MNIGQVFFQLLSAHIMIYFDLCYLCTLLCTCHFLVATAECQEGMSASHYYLQIYSTLKVPKNSDIKAFKSVCVLLKILHCHTVKSQGRLLSNKGLFNLNFRLRMSQQFFSYPYLSIAIKNISCRIFVGFFCLEVLATIFLPLHF